MRQLIALALVLAGAASAIVQPTGWTQGYVTSYYVTEGCGTDLGKKLLIIRLNGYDWGISSSDPTYADILETTEYAFRNNKQMALMVAGTAAEPTRPSSFIFRQPMPEGNCVAGTEKYKIFAFSSK